MLEVALSSHSRGLRRALDERPQLVGISADQRRVRPPARRLDRSEHVADETFQALDISDRARALFCHVAIEEAQSAERLQRACGRLDEAFERR